MMLQLYAGNPVWEVIGDTTVSSPVASVTHTYDPALYSRVHTTAKALLGESGQPAPYQVVLQDDGVLTGFDTGIVGLGSDTETFFGDVFYSEGDGAVTTEWFTYTSDEASNRDSANFSESQPATREVTWKLLDNNSVDIDIISGRVTTYGLRLP